MYLAVLSEEVEGHGTKWWRLVRKSEAKERMLGVKALGPSSAPTMKKVFRPEL